LLLCEISQGQPNVAGNNGVARIRNRAALHNPVQQVRTAHGPSVAVVCSIDSTSNHVVGSGIDESIARAFVVLAPFGVSAKIPASDACSEIGPKPAFTRKGAKDRPRWRRHPHPRPEAASTKERTTMSDNPRRRSRRHKRIRVEPLESRALLSPSVSSVFSLMRSVIITPSSEFTAARTPFH
jgi:hypothetical protein